MARLVRRRDALPLWRQRRAGACPATPAAYEIVSRFKITRARPRLGPSVIAARRSIPPRRVPHGLRHPQPAEYAPCAALAVMIQVPAPPWQQRRPVWTSLRTAAQIHSIRCPTSKTRPDAPEHNTRWNDRQSRVWRLSGEPCLRGFHEPVRAPNAAVVRHHRRRGKRRRARRHTLETDSFASALWQTAPWQRSLTGPRGTTTATRTAGAVFVLPESVRMWCGHGSEIREGRLKSRLTTQLERPSFRWFRTSPFGFRGRFDFARDRGRTVFAPIPLTLKGDIQEPLASAHWR